MSYKRSSGLFFHPNASNLWFYLPYHPNQPRRATSARLGFFFHLNGFTSTSLTIPISPDELQALVWAFFSSRQLHFYISTSLTIPIGPHEWRALVWSLNPSLSPPCSISSSPYIPDELLVSCPPLLMVLSLSLDRSDNFVITWYVFTESIYFSFRWFFT